MTFLVDGYRYNSSILREILIPPEDILSRYLWGEANYIDYVLLHDADRAKPL
jgi:hypothetical protein